MVSMDSQRELLLGIFVKPEAKSNPVTGPLGFLGHEIVQISKMYDQGRM
jgi:hypothetical protein